MRASIAAGNFKVNGAVVESAAYKIKEGDLIEHKSHRHEIPVAVDDIQFLDVTDDVYVVYKPGGLPMHAGAGYNKNTLLSILTLEYKLTDIYIIYRLDRLTSGVVVLGRSQAVARAWGQDLQAQRLHKTYLAVVEHPELLPEHNGQSFSLNFPVATLDPRSGRCHCPKEGGKAATTRVTVLARHEKAALVQCEPLTGRTHQIRLHLAQLGCAILGDSLYQPEADTSPAEKKQKHQQQTQNSHSVTTFFSNREASCQKCRDQVENAGMEDEPDLQLHAWRYRDSRDRCYEAAPPSWVWQCWKSATVLPSIPTFASLPKEVTQTPWTISISQWLCLSWEHWQVWGAVLGRTALEATCHRHALPAFALDLVPPPTDWDAFPWSVWWTAFTGGVVLLSPSSRPLRLLASCLSDPVDLLRERSKEIQSAVHTSDRIVVSFAQDRQTHRESWKNGPGWTEEIIRWPRHAGWDSFHWRISIAGTTAGTLPFSAFPSVDRSLVVLKGGCQLRRTRSTGAALETAAAGAPAELTLLTPAMEEPFCFAGEDSILCVVNDSLVDLNIMTRRGVFEHSLFLVTLSESEESPRTIALCEGITVIVEVVGNAVWVYQTPSGDSSEPLPAASYWVAHILPLLPK